MVTLIPTVQEYKGKHWASKIPYEYKVPFGNSAESIETQSSGCENGK